MRYNEIRQTEANDARFIYSKKIFTKPILRNQAYQFQLLVSGEIGLCYK